MADRDPKGTVDPEDPDFAAKFTIPADAFEVYRYGQPAILRRSDPQPTIPRQNSPRAD